MKNSSASKPQTHGITTGGYVPLPSSKDNGDTKPLAPTDLGSKEVCAAGMTNQDAGMEVIGGGEVISPVTVNGGTCIETKDAADDDDGLAIMESFGLKPIQSDKFHKLERVRSPAMDSIIGLAWPVLDHGFIRVIDYMGKESSIVQAARVSCGTGTKAVSEDISLLRYLMRHRHTSPFEMCEIKFHVKLPIFIARQWIRHRMASVNEYSARYSILDSEFYLPSPENIAVQSTNNKQGRGDTVSHETAQKVLEILRQDADRNAKDYGDMIDPDKDMEIARELARINLTLNTYTEWYWKIDVHNLLHFLGLRLHPHAQFEIREYAAVMLKILGLWMPNVHQAWKDYSFEAHSFSRAEMELVRLVAQMAANAGLTRESVLKMAQDKGLSGREARIFADAIFSEQQTVLA